MIQRGDPEIAGALMAGVMAGRAEAAEKAGVVRETRTSSVSGEAAATFPTRNRARTAGASASRTAHEMGRLWAAEEPGESVEIVSAEARDDRMLALRVRIAVGNSKTAEDYRHMIIKARGDYAVRQRSGPLHTVAGKLLLAWALLWQGIRRAYRAQDRVLRPR